jgi:hypothetical protein
MYWFSLLMLSWCLVALPASVLLGRHLRDATQSVRPSRQTPTS